MNTNKQFEILKIDTECPACKKAETAARKISVSRIIQRLDACFEKNDLKSADSLLNYWADEARALGDLSGELSMVNEQLGLFRKTQNAEGAAYAVERALKLIELTDSSKSVSGATIMINAATTCKAFGRAKESIALYETAAEIYSRLLPKDDLKTAALYNNFATALVDLDFFERAEELYKKAAEITGSCKEGLLDCAVTYVNMAHLYEKWQGIESEKIADCLSRAEVILENQAIVQNGYYAFVCEKCAPSFDYFGYFVAAQNLYKKSREIYERA